MKLPIVVLCVAGLAGAAQAFETPAPMAEGDPRPAARPEVRVSLQARDLPLRAALKQLAAGTREVLQVDRDVPDLPVRLQLRDIPLEQAVRLVTRQVSRAGVPITYRAIEHGFRVLRGELPPEEEENPLRVTVTPRKDPAPVPQPAEAEAPAAPKGEETDAGGASPEIGAEPPVIEGTPGRVELYIIPPFRPTSSWVWVGRSVGAGSTGPLPEKESGFQIKMGWPRPRSIMPPRGSGIVPRSGGKRKPGAPTGGGGFGRRPL